MILDIVAIVYIETVKWQAIYEKKEFIIDSIILFIRRNPEGHMMVRCVEPQWATIFMYSRDPCIMSTAPRLKQNSSVQTGLWGISLLSVIQKGSHPERKEGVRGMTAAFAEPNVVQIESICWKLLVRATNWIQCGTHALFLGIHSSNL